MGFLRMGLLDNLGTQFPPIKSDTPHYEAIGRFVTSFAGAEASVHLLARKLSGLSDSKARIIFGGTRLSDLANIVRQVVKVDGLSHDTSSEIESCLTQLGLISKKRHNLVHRSTTFFDGKLFVTNLYTSKSAASFEHEVFDVPELSDMQSDCIHIYLRLHRIAMPESETARAVIQEREFCDELLRRPWRYKPRPPKKPGLKSRATPAR